MPLKYTQIFEKLNEKLYEIQIYNIQKKNPDTD